MATSSVTKQQTALLKPDDSGTDIKRSVGSGVAFYLNPTCKHKWSKLPNELQTLESEGKIIWKCGDCSEISTTYDWHTPEG